MQLPFKISEREKKFLIIGGIVIICIIAFQLFSWYSDTKTRVKEISDAKLLMLHKQLEKIAEKDLLQKRFKAVKEELDRQERKLLSGNTPPVAAAALQRFLKDTASSLNVEVKLERTLNPVNGEYYLGIPVEIGFTATTKELKDLLLRLRRARFLLTVSEMKIRVTNISRPEKIYTTLVVTGFIKKAPEEAKNAT